MTVRVRYFAALRERLGSGESRAVRTGTTVAALWSDVVAEHPGLARMPVRVAVNAHYVAMSVRLRENDEVAFFPPVSGGA